MHIDKSKYLDKINALAFSGSSYEEIKKYLKTQISDQVMIDVLMVDANVFIAQYQIASQKRDEYLNKTVIYGVLCLFGFIATYMSLMSTSYTRFIFYGAMVIGGYHFYNNYKIYKKPLKSHLVKKKKKKDLKRFRSRV